MNQCLLTDRGIISISGDDAESLLHRLFTRNMQGMATGCARYAALLSPQGKILFDFLVFRRPDAFWIDVARAKVEDLARKLTLFRLRAKVTIEARPDLAVAASWDGALMDAPGPALRDPRHDALGYRIIAAAQALQHLPADTRDYHAHRVALGIPEGGIDFVYGDTFVHEANLDLLHGVDFDKGCYVGQEVVSRVHHRSTARKRIVKIDFYGDPPAIGTALAAGQVPIGHVTSIADRVGLAAARIDRLEEAEAAHQPVLAGETLVGITLPSLSHVTPPSYAEDAV